MFAVPGNCVWFPEGRKWFFGFLRAYYAYLSLEWNPSDCMAIGVDYPVVKPIVISPTFLSGWHSEQIRSGISTQPLLGGIIRIGSSALQQMEKVSPWRIRGAENPKKFRKMSKDSQLFQKVGGRESQVMWRSSWLLLTIVNYLKIRCVGLRIQRSEVLFWASISFWVWDHVIRVGKWTFSNGSVLAFCLIFAVEDPKLS